LFELGGSARAQRQLGAFARVGEGDCLADASAAAGNHRNFVLELHGMILGMME